MKEIFLGGEAPAVYVTPENSMFPTEARLLAELVVMPPEIVAEQLPLLRKATDQVMATAVSPHERDMIRYTHDILEWDLFGQLGDTLPKGLALVQSDEDTRVKFDERRWFAYHCAETTHRDLEKVGAEEVINTVRTDLMSRERDAKLSLLESVAMQTPLYAFLESFDQQVMTSPEEVPLNEEKRQAKLNEALEKIRRVHHLAPGEPITKGSPAEYDARKARGKLELATELSAQTPFSQGDALTRAREYYSSRLMQIIYPDTSDDYRQQERVRLLRTENSDELGDLISELIYDEATVLKVDDMDPLAREVTMALLDTAITRILLSPPERDYADLLRSSVSTTSTSTLETIWEPIGRLNFTSRDSGLRAWLLSPRAEVVHDSEVEGRMDSHRHATDATLLTAREIAKERSVIVGHVRSPIADGNMRLVQTQLRDENMPDIPDDYDLFLSLYITAEMSLQYADPYVPGFTLVGRTRQENKYAFVRDPEGDPYAPARMPIEKARLEGLTEKYNQLGLTELSDRLTSVEAVTVEELVALLKDYSEYFIPDKVPGSLVDRPSTFEGFELLVNDGKLQVQCTGAAKFLELSLEYIFGPGTTRIIDGITLSDDVTLRAIRHAQVGFTHEGRLYILDSTPSHRDSSRSKSNRDTNLAAPAAAVLNRTSELDPEEPVRPVERLEMTRANRLLALRSALETHARAYFGVRSRDREALYARFLTISEVDPLRQVLGTVLQATKGDRLTSEDMTTLHEKIAFYREFTPEGTRRYSDDFLAFLGQTIDHAELLITESPHELTDN
ncbi:MAG: hypothetical protein ABWX94_02630 [Candidatus Saccharimonadales bacterium]